MLFLSPKLHCGFGMNCGRWGSFSQVLLSPCCDFYNWIKSVFKVLPESLPSFPRILWLSSEPLAIMTSETLSSTSMLRLYMPSFTLWDVSLAACFCLATFQSYHPHQNIKAFNHINLNTSELLWLALLLHSKKVLSLHVLPIFAWVLPGTLASSNSPKTCT